MGIDAATKGQQLSNNNYLKKCKHIFGPKKMIYMFFGPKKTILTSEP